MPSQHVLLEITAPLAGDEAAQPFPEVMANLMSTGRLPDHISDFSLSIVAYTLYR